MLLKLHTISVISVTLVNRLCIGFGVCVAFVYWFCFWIIFSGEDWACTNLIHSEALLVCCCYPIRDSVSSLKNLLIMYAVLWWSPSGHGWRTWLVLCLPTVRFSFRSRFCPDLNLCVTFIITSVCWELTYDGLVSHPGESKTLIHLTLQKPERNASPMGYQTRKEFSFIKAQISNYFLFHFNVLTQLTRKIVVNSISRSNDSFPIQIRPEWIYNSVCIRNWKARCAMKLFIPCKLRVNSAPIFHQVASVSRLRKTTFQQDLIAKILSRSIMSW